MVLVPTDDFCEMSIRFPTDWTEKRKRENEFENSERMKRKRDDLVHLEKQRIDRCSLMDKNVNNRKKEKHIKDCEEEELKKQGEIDKKYL